MSSLRNKIMTTYGLSTLALLIFVAIVIADLHFLQTQIIEGEAVNKLYTTAQEIRREEKNLFLYNHEKKLDQLQLQLGSAQKLYLSSTEVLSEFASQQEISAIGSTIKRYRQLIDEYKSLSRQERNSKQSNIRKTGHELSEIIRNINQRQHTALEKTTRFAQKTLIVASLTLIIIAIVSALIMVRRVVRPMGQLEAQLDEVAEGRERNLTLSSSDKEIQSFVHHFNSMLDQLRRQQHQLRQHEKAAALGVLVSGVAHELNNPLSNISTSAQLIMEDDGSTRDDLRKQWLSHIDSECDRARRIVRRLLDSVRQPKHQTRLIKASELVQSAVLLVHRQFHEFLFHIEDITDAPVPVDRERMQQVFINLVKNAFDAGSSNIWITGNKTSWADSRPVDRDILVGDPTELRQADKIVLFHIDDDGPGINPDHLAKVFDPFFTTQAGGEGTGLGLYLVEEIISEHSGCIAAENRPQGGTRFSIWLPADNTPESDSAQETT